MKLEYKTDNIIFAPEELIIHGCNAQGVMGSGVALAIRNRWPRAYAYYRGAYERNKKKLELGTVIYIADFNPTPKYIGNCITQEYYGRDSSVQYCSYEAIEKCLLEVKNFCLDNNIHAFAMPKIGCGLGGGKWEVVLKIIEKVFSDTELTVVVYDNQIIATQSSSKL